MISTVIVLLVIGFQSIGAETRNYNGKIGSNDTERTTVGNYRKKTIWKRKKDLDIARPLTAVTTAIGF